MVVVLVVVVVGLYSAMGGRHEGGKTVMGRRCSGVSLLLLLLINFYFNDPDKQEQRLLAGKLTFAQSC